MSDPAERTYPTTITSTYSTVHSTAGVATTDHVTVIDPWPVSPDPESFPYTLLQTAITQRTISPASATPSTSSITATSTWFVWSIQPFDMPPSGLNDCSEPGECTYGAIKPHPRCDEQGRETRCVAQCLLKDWMWWCIAAKEGQMDPPMGRVCAASNSTDYKQLLEPCDHTDFSPLCPLCPEEDG